jgi:micrococcal nuclease
VKDTSNLFGDQEESTSDEMSSANDSRPVRHPLIRRVATAVVVIIGIIAGLLSCSAAANATSGDVVRVVDGDTLVVSINNVDQTIRLLNVDTPETKDPNEPVECLGPEATKFLKETLPVGTHIRLDFDVEKHDKYGRTLAGVFTSAGALVNAEIARQGLGIPMSVGRNTKYLNAVQSAHGEAKAAGNGLFSTSISCTLPAQIQASEATLEAAETAAQPATSSAATTGITATVGAITTAKSLQRVLNGGPDSSHPVLWAALASSDLVRHLARITTAIDRTNSMIPAMESQRDHMAAAEAQAAADKKAAEERAIAEKKAAEEQAAAEKRAAEEQAAADKAAADAAASEAERIRNLPVYVPPAPKPYVPPAPPAYVPPAPPAASDPYPGYHGPRCYAPGGKSWRPCP